MAAAKIADAATIRRLSKAAEARGEPALSDEALHDLDPDARHIGVVVQVRGITPPSEATGDEETWVVWLLVMAGRTGHFVVHMVCKLRDVAVLPDVEIPDEVAERAVEAAQRYHGELVFEAQARSEIERLIRGES